MLIVKTCTSRTNVSLRLKRCTTKCVNSLQVLKTCFRYSTNYPDKINTLYNKHNCMCQHYMDMDEIYNITHRDLQCIRGSYVTTNNVCILLRYIGEPGVEANG